MIEKSALICGVSGQDGAYLARLLIDKGYRVTGTSRDAQVSSFNNLVRLGIRDRLQLLSMVGTDFRSVLNVVAKVQPDEIYNLAGQSSVGLSFEQPMETLESIALGTLNLLEVMRFIGQPMRLYNAGSSECFGATGDAAADEATPFHPRSPYAVAKSASVWAVANYRDAYGLYACSGLLFNHESPLRPERFVTQKIVSAACRIARGDRRPLHLGSLDIRRDWGGIRRRHAPHAAARSARRLRHRNRKHVFAAAVRRGGVRGGRARLAGLGHQRPDPVPSQ